MLTARVSDPSGYGRIVRDEAGALAGIVEDADATPEQRAIDEINSGCYAFDGALLADAVERVAAGNAQGQEYLTDVVGILREDGRSAGTVLATDPAEIQGVNDRIQLAQARRACNSRLLEDWMRAGVTVVDPAATWIDVDVTLGEDAQVLPGTFLEGRTAIGPGARVGPNCVLRDTTVAPGRHGALLGLRVRRDRQRGQHRPVRLPAAGHADRRRRPPGRLRRAEERDGRRGNHDPAPVLLRRRGHRRGHASSARPRAPAGPAICGPPADLPQDDDEGAAGK